MQRTFCPLPAADITGDGQPEAMFAVQTGGSHCCSGIALYSLGDVPEAAFCAVGGGGGIGTMISGVQDLDGDGVYELLGRLFLSGPCTWPSVQLILQFDGQGYVEAGQRFAAQYRGPDCRVNRSAVAGRNQAVDGYKCSGVLEPAPAYLYAGQDVHGLDGVLSPVPCSGCRRVPAEHKSRPLCCQ